MMATPHEVTGPINIGNPDEQTIATIAGLVLEMTGSTSTITRHPVPADDPTRRQPDITRARQTLGWEPTIALRDGLARTIADFRTRLGLDAPGQPAAAEVALA